MKKRRKTSIAWFLFFGALGCLLPDQWKMIVFVLAGFASARWITSRVRINLFYMAWFIFPVLCFMFMDSVGNRTVGWCEKNNPSVLIDNAVHHIKGISNEESSEMTRDLVDKSLEVKQELIPAIKDFVKDLSKRFFANSVKM